MQIDTTGRIIGSFLIVSAYFIVLHVSATVGANNKTEAKRIASEIDNIDDKELSITLED